MRSSRRFLWTSPNSATMNKKIRQKPATNPLALQGAALSFELNLDERLRVKLEKSLPMTDAEYGRLVLQLFKVQGEIWNYMNKIVERINELEASLPGSEVDPNPQG